MTRTSTRTFKIAVVAAAAAVLAGCAGQPEFVVPRSLNLAAVAPTAADLESVWNGGWNVTQSEPFDVSSDDIEWAKNATDNDADLPEACREFYARVGDASAESSSVRTEYHNGGGSGGFGGSIEIQRARDQNAAATIYDGLVQYELVMGCWRINKDPNFKGFECSDPFESKVVEGATVRFCEDTHDGYSYERSVVRATIHLGNAVIISQTSQQDSVDIELDLRQDIAERVLEITVAKLRAVVGD